MRNKEQKVNKSSNRVHIENNLQRYKRNLINFNKTSNVKVSELPTLGRDTTILFVLKNITFVNSTFVQKAMMKYPNLIKIIFFYKECFECNEFKENYFNENVKDFMSKLWNDGRVLYTYFLPYCSLCYTDSISCNIIERKRFNQRNKHDYDDDNGFCLTKTIYYYNPFEKYLAKLSQGLVLESRSSRSLNEKQLWGKLEKFDFSYKNCEKQHQKSIDLTNNSHPKYTPDIIAINESKNLLNTNSTDDYDKIQEIYFNNKNHNNSNKNNLSLDILCQNLTILAKSFYKINSTDSYNGNCFNNNYYNNDSNSNNNINNNINNNTYNFANDKDESFLQNYNDIDLYLNKFIMPKLLNLNHFEMTVIFFPTTLAFLKEETDIFKNIINKKMLYHNTTDSYFGVDIEMLKQLSKSMNFIPILSKTSDGMYYGFKEPNGTFNGALGDVIYKRAEFIMNGFFVKDYETRDLEFSTATYDDKLCVVVRTADLIPESLLIFQCFTTYVWMTMALTAVIVSLAYSTLLKFIEILDNFEKSLEANLLNNNNQMRNIYVNKVDEPHHVRYFGETKAKTKIRTKAERFYAAIRIIGVLLCAPVSGIGGSFHERLFVAVCLLWGLNMSGAFQGSLVDVYTTPTSYPNIDTLETLDKSGIPIGVRHQGLIVDLFGSEQPGTPLGNLRTKLKPSDDDFLCSRIAGQGDIAGLERILDYQRLSQKSIRNDGVTLLHLVKECPRSYTLGYLFPKSSIFLDTVNHYLLIYMESGLFQKWYTDTTYIFDLEAGIKNREYIKDSKITLTIKHLQLPFFILLFGIVLSTFVFIIENLHKKYVKI